MRNVYDLAKMEIGTYEWAEGSNPRVDAYFDDVGFPAMNDDTAWCAAFVGSMLKRSGYSHTGKLTARSYIDWGKPVDLKDAQPGDVAVFWRGSPDSWQGHVGFFDRHADGMIYTLGGNQRNQVNISAYPANKLLSIRRMERTSKTQSTTIRAVAGTAAASGVGYFQAFSQLDPITQYILLGTAAVSVLFLLWIVRERLRKWGAGDR